LSIAVRIATTADAEHVARLVSVLGYPTSPAHMCKRLESILSDEDYTTLVACDACDADQSDRVVGFVGTRVGPLYENDGLGGQIVALAVAPEYQRQGIGRMLMREAESMLIARGVISLFLTSGNHRSDAHAFYERHGYAFTGRRYKKHVSSSA
jgi:ribosomal protein S18 acetylase RimI-like enzyme